MINYNFEQDKTILQLIKAVENKFGELSEIQPIAPEKYFASLVESIVSQQLSVKVADVIYSRLETKLVNVDAESILSAEIDALRAVGLSNAKASYIKNLAQAWQTTISPNNWQQYTDEEVITDLVKVKGIGVWTAEMFLIFSLGRPNIFSVGDYGLRKAMQKTYQLPATTKPAEYQNLAEKWSPHKSYISRVLWKSLEL